MIPGILTEAEQVLLLKYARQALEHAVNGQKPPSLDLDSLPPRFQEPGATFVTLTRMGELRGCIGALDAYQPLVEDVMEHAITAALQDYRFPPVCPEELSHICIEISHLTPPKRMDYEEPEELLQKLRPCIDGVVLKDGRRRATFLPQVWEKLPDPGLFLSYLCHKMGANPELWRSKKLEVYTYQVEKFHE